MKKVLIVLGLFLLFPQLAFAQSQRNPCAYLGSNSVASLQGNCLPIGYYLSGITGVPMPVGGIANVAAPTFVEAKPGYLSFDLSGNLRTIATITPSGTQNVNLTQILSAAPSAANPLWVFPATGATFPVSAASLPLPSGASTSANQILNNAPVAPAAATATNSTLIGCQDTSAAINPTTGQQGAINCDLNNNILVSSGGAPNLATSQVSITTGNITAVAARALRRAVTITNVTGTSAIFCGNTGVATTTGTYLGATAGSSITLNTTAAVFCTVAVTTQTVTVAETF